MHAIAILIVYWACEGVVLVAVLLSPVVLLLLLLLLLLSSFTYILSFFCYWRWWRWWWLRCPPCLCLFKFPWSSAERASLLWLWWQPLVDALNVKGMGTDTPHHWCIITWELRFRGVAIEWGTADATDIVTCSMCFFLMNECDFSDGGSGKEKNCILMLGS